MSPRFSLTTLALLSLLASTAHADDKTASCTQAYAQGQSLRDAHKLTEAREQLHTCAASPCPGFIVKDCTAWLVDLEGRIPTVVLSAKGPAGQSLPDVTVSVDGGPAHPLDGAALEMNPGAHTFAFVGKDGTKVERSFLVLEGQKSQPVSVELETPPGPVMTPAAQAPTPRQAPAKAAFWTTEREVGAGLGGVGLVGVILGSVFGSIASSAASQQKTDCASPTVCPDHMAALSEHTTASTDSTVSTVALVAGGVLVAGGGVLLATGGKRAEASAPTALSVMPTAGPGGGLVLRGGF